MASTLTSSLKCAARRWKSSVHGSTRRQSASCAAGWGFCWWQKSEGLAPTDAEVEAAAAHWDAKLDGERTFPANDARKVRQRLARERAEQFIVEHSTPRRRPMNPSCRKLKANNNKGAMRCIAPLLLLSGTLCGLHAPRTGCCRAWRRSRLQQAARRGCPAPQCGHPSSQESRPPRGWWKGGAPQ